MYYLLIVPELQMTEYADRGLLPKCMTKLIHFRLDMLSINPIQMSLTLNLGYSLLGEHTLTHANTFCIYSS